MYVAQFLLLALLAAGDNVIGADVVLSKDGARITGKLQSWSQEAIVILDSRGETVRLAPSEVDGLHLGASALRQITQLLPASIEEAVPPDEPQASAAPGTPPLPIPAAIDSAPGPRLESELALPPLPALQPLQPAAPREVVWTVTSRAGYSGDRGTTDVDGLDGNFTAIRETQVRLPNGNSRLRHSLELTSDYAYNRQVVVVDSETGERQSSIGQNRLEGRAELKRYYSQKGFVNVFTQLETDRVNAIDLRTKVEAGFGFVLLQSEASTRKLNLGGSAGYTRTNFSILQADQTMIRNRPSATFSESYLQTLFSNPNAGDTRLTQTFEYNQQDLTTLDRFRINFVLQLSQDLTRFFNFYLRVEDQFDNETDLIEPNRFSISTGFGVQWN